MKKNFQIKKIGVLMLSYSLRYYFVLIITLSLPGCCCFVPIVVINTDRLREINQQWRKSRDAYKKQKELEKAKKQQNKESARPVKDESLGQKKADAQGGSSEKQTTAQSQT